MTVYFAGNVVFKTRDFGDTWEKISPDLTTDDPDKQGEAGGPAWTENTTAEYHCTIISFAESPVEAGVLWSGSDDGQLYVSRDGGENWTNVIGNVSGIPEFSPVSHIEPSRTDAGTAYAAFDRHMFDDLHPHIYKTTDFGQTWSRLSTDGIPDQAWVWIVREDPRNTDLLWAGTELGLYASYDTGGSWQRMHLKNLPTVAIHDILVHPRENDLILGTHGRAIWIFDDATPLQQFSDEVAAQKAALFEIRPAIRFPTRFTRYGLGDKSHRAPNPPAGALITYFVQEKIEEEKPGKKGEDGEDAEKPDDAEENGKKEERIKIEILDSAGEIIQTLDGEKLGKEAGLNRVAWNLAADPARPRKDEKPEPSFFRPEPRGPMVLPGTYTVRLTVDGESHEQPVEVGIDPMVAVSAADLATEYSVASELTAMQSAVNDGLRGLDALKSQLEARRATVKLT